MFLSRWRDALTRRPRPSRPIRGRRTTYRPRAEELEVRCVPAAFNFSTGAPDGLVGTGSRPAAASNNNIELESADDFILPSETSIDHVTFTGLLPANATATDVVIEFYRVFPKDSNVARTTGAPTFAVPPNIPTRVNSPSDVAFASQDVGTTGVTTTLVNPAFSVAHSIVNNIAVGGPDEGPVTGQEVTFDVALSTPFLLPADHYFFVPQVLLDNGQFLWLSAPKPTNPPLFQGDLQSWMRNDPGIAPDWLRIGTDILHAGPFNASFALSGQTVTPTLTKISPDTVLEGGPALTVTLTGTNFTGTGTTATSTVQVNGTPIAATFDSSTKLTVTVPASLVAEDGALTFTVTDSGVTTGGLTLAVNEGVASGSASLTKFTLAGKGANATISGSFTDQVNEAHTVRILWGDGKSSTFDAGISTSGTFSLSHRFKKAPRNKTALVQVLDDGSPIFQIGVTLTAAKHHKKKH
jgi:hypothetical protein